MIWRVSLLLVVAVIASGCGMLDRFRKADAPLQAAQPADQPAAQIAPPVETSVLETSALGAGGQSAAALDTTTAAERAQALAAPVVGAERELGRVVVALGSPAEQGLWLRSALVQAVAQGRVVTTAGQTLAVELRPGTGAAQLSLAGFQALGLGLTDLPEVTVFGP